MCKHAVKNLLLLIRYVTDKYRTQQTCDKAMLENGWTSKCVSDC